MTPWQKLRTVSFVLVGICLSFPASAQQRVLPIPPVAQSTPVWCWAAVGEMVFRHYKVPNVNPAGHYQCGIVGSLGGPCAYNCGNCIFPAGQLGNLASVIAHYPQVVGRLTGWSGSELDGEPLAATISPDEIIEQIDARRPIIAGISPSGFPYPPGLAEHVALIIGYRVGPQDLLVIVNDPYPFPPWHDPYQKAGAQRIAPGRYLIPHSILVTHLGWNSTILISD